jgi:hypothetical protein
MVWSRLSLIRPSATFSREKKREKANDCRLLPLFVREKVAEGRMREFSPQSSKNPQPRPPPREYGSRDANGSRGNHGSDH